MRSSDSLCRSQRLARLAREQFVSHTHEVVNEVFLGCLLGSLGIDRNAANDERRLTQRLVPGLVEKFARHVCTEVACSLAETAEAMRS